MFHMNRFKALVAGLVLAAIPALAVAKPPQTGTPDISPIEITLKEKCKDVCTVKNFTVYSENLGDGDAKNSRIFYYLSDDDALSTETDLLIHQHSLGKLKVGKIKKKTVGGGKLKKAGAVSGQYVIAVFDANEEVEEVDEENNIVVSDPLP